MIREKEYDGGDEDDVSTVNWSVVESDSNSFTENTCNMGAVIAQSV
jgi:hypothetical protein